MAIWVRVTEGPGAGQEVEVGEGLVVGRDADADLTIEDPGVSRRHLRLRAEGVTAIVEDLDSSNGTYVNGEQIAEPRRLRSGDLVQAGESTLEIDAGTTETELIDDPAATELRPPPPPVRREPEAPRRAPEPPPARPTPAGVPEPEIAGEDGGLNWQAIAAVVLGPLSVLLLLFGSGVAFYVALPCGILAIALGSAAKRRARTGAGMQGVAVAGQVAGIVGTILATLVVLVLIGVGVATDIAADNLADLVDEVEAEIRNEVGGQVPDVAPG